MRPGLTRKYGYATPASVSRSAFSATSRAAVSIRCQRSTSTSRSRIAVSITWSMRPSMFAYRPTPGSAWFAK